MGLLSDQWISCWIGWRTTVFQVIIICWKPLALAGFIGVVNPDLWCVLSFLSGGKTLPSFSSLSSSSSSGKDWKIGIWGGALLLLHHPPFGWFGSVTDICPLSAMSATTSVTSLLYAVYAALLQALWADYCLSSSSLAWPKYHVFASPHIMHPMRSHICVGINLELGSMDNLNLNTPLHPLKRSSSLKPSSYPHVRFYILFTQTSWQQDPKRTRRTMDLTGVPGQQNADTQVVGTIGPLSCTRAAVTTRVCYATWTSNPAMWCMSLTNWVEREGCCKSVEAWEWIAWCTWTQSNRASWVGTWCT